MEEFLAARPNVRATGLFESLLREGYAGSYQLVERRVGARPRVLPSVTGLFLPEELAEHFRLMHRTESTLLMMAAQHSAGRLLARLHRPQHFATGRLFDGYGRGYGHDGQCLASVAIVGYPKKEAPGGSSAWGFSYYLVATLLRGPALQLVKSK